MYINSTIQQFKLIHSTIQSIHINPPIHHHGTEETGNLKETAAETLRILPSIVAQHPDLHLDESILYDAATTLTALDPAQCPKLPKTKVRVIRSDTFEAAIALLSAVKTKTRPAALNFASHAHPGGGWRNGARAQEEALCYRSTLSLSLHQRYYRLRPTQGIYTRDVVVFRSSMADDHVINNDPNDHHVLSVLSVPAVNRPKRAYVEALGRDILADPVERALTLTKMRLVLRMAAVHGHRTIVLGALGCGAFQNPVEDVAACWREVLTEPEFAGGWWDDVVFAVYDGRRERNAEHLAKELEGLEV